MRVSQVSSVSPGGSAVLLRPSRKSSIRTPIETAKKAFEQEPMLKRVYEASSAPRSSYSMSATHIRSHVGALLGHDPP